MKGFNSMDEALGLLILPASYQPEFPLEYVSEENPSLEILRTQPVAYLDNVQFSQSESHIYREIILYIPH